MNYEAKKWNVIGFQETKSRISVFKEFFELCCMHFIHILQNIESLLKPLPGWSHSQTLGDFAKDFEMR